jgi:HK97 family phage major capsid protein
MTAPISLADFQAGLVREIGGQVKGLVDPIAAKLTVLEGQVADLKSKNPDPALAAAAQPAKAPAIKTDRSKEEDANDKVPGIMVGRVARSLAVAGGRPEVAHEWAKRRWGGDHGVCKAIEALQAKSSHLATDFDTGGSWLQPEFSQDFIDTLRPASVVRSMMGPGGIVGLSGAASITWPRATGNTTAYWTGESQSATVSNMTTGQLTASARKHAGIVLVSRDLLRYGGASVDVRITNNLTKSIALLQDLAFIRGLPGLTHSPRGIRYWAASANILSSTSTASNPTLTQVNADLARMINQLEQSNVAMANLGWLMSPRTKNVMQFARGSDGHEVAFANEISQKGTLLGAPIGRTTQIPNNLGGGGDESELYLVDFGECVITDYYAVEITVSSEASVLDGSTTVNTFQQDMMAIRGVAATDFTMLHPEGAVVLTGTKWSTPPIG